MFMRNYRPMWLGASRRLLARPLVAVIGGFLLLVVLAIVFQQGDRLSGQIVELRPVPGRGTIVAELEVPAQDHQFVVLPVEMAGMLQQGSWVTFNGRWRTTDTLRFLVAEDSWSLPTPDGAIVKAASSRTRGWQSWLIHRPVYAVAMGALILVFGAFTLRLCSTLVVSGLWGLLAWHLLGWLEASGRMEFGPTWALLLLSGIVAFAVFRGSYRRARPLGGLLPRLALLSVAFLLAPEFARYFGWPPLPMSIILSVGILMSPTLGIWALGSLFLASGLGTDHLGLLAVFGIAAVYTWLASREPVRGARHASRRPRNRDLSPNKHFEIPFNQLLDK